MSIATEIERMQNAKASIKTAIENKGVTVGDGLIDTYASKIDEITTGGGGTDFEINDTSYLFYGNARIELFDFFLKACKDVTNSNNMFFNGTKFPSLDLSGFDTSKVTDMSRMFGYCRNLITLDLSNFDTSKVTDMNRMFYYCDKLQSLDVSNFDVSEVTNMNYMFGTCRELKSLDLSNFTTNKVTDMSYMFDTCRGLKSLDLSNFDASKVTNSNSMFSVCYELTNLFFMNNLGKGYTYQGSNYNPYSLNVSYSNLLTHDSLMDVINKVYDLNLTYNVANGGTLRTQQLAIGSTNMAKLTADEIAIATNKGWVVS